MEVEPVTPALIGLATFIVLGAFAAWLMHEAAKGARVVKPRNYALMGSAVLVPHMKAAVEAAEAFQRSMQKVALAMGKAAPAMERLAELVRQTEAERGDVA